MTNDIVPTGDSKSSYAVPQGLLSHDGKAVALLKNELVSFPYYEDVVWCIKDENGNIVTMNLAGELDARSRCLPGEEYGVIVKKSADYFCVGPPTKLIK